MNDDMNDLAPALLVAVVVAVGLVAFQFRAELLSTPANAAVAKVEKAKVDKTATQVATNDRLYWIR